MCVLKLISFDSVGGGGYGQSSGPIGPSFPMGGGSGGIFKPTLGL